MKLQKLSTFVIEQHTLYYCRKISLEQFHSRLMKYTNFTQTPITIGMFIPCIDGKPVEEPDFLDGSYDDNGYGDTDKRRYKKDLEAYQKAKEAVLFVGFKTKEHESKFSPQDYSVCEEDEILHVMWRVRGDERWVASRGLKTIEDLIPYNLTLTPSAVENVLGLR